MPRLPDHTKLSRSGFTGVSSRSMRLLTLCAFFCTVTPLYNAVCDTPRTRTATAIRVVDGDTIKVQVNDSTESVRLIGIDAPESHRNERSKKQAARTARDVATIVGLGLRSKTFVEQLIPPGTALKLEQDVGPRDRYGRLLAYVYLPDGTMANETILKMGFASTLTIPPNIKYSERFNRAVQESRQERKGLWAEGPLP